MKTRRPHSTDNLSIICSKCETKCVARLHIRHYDDNQNNTVSQEEQKMDLCVKRFIQTFGIFLKMSAGYDERAFNYKRPKDKRRCCIEDIIVQRDEAGIFPLPSFDDTQTRFEHCVPSVNKIEQSKVSGDGASNVYNRKWWHFLHFLNFLHFLPDNVKPWSTRWNIEKRFTDMGTY